MRVCRKKERKEGVQGLWLKGRGEIDLTRFICTQRPTHGSDLIRGERQRGREGQREREERERETERGERE